MTDKWLCGGPGGTYGEGIVGNGWQICHQNQVPSLQTQCQNMYKDLTGAREYCKGSVKNEIDLNPTSFQPEQHSCIITKNSNLCQGNYVGHFQRKGNPKSYYHRDGSDMETSKGITIN